MTAQPCRTYSVLSIALLAISQNSSKKGDTQDMDILLIPVEKHSRDTDNYDNGDKENNADTNHNTTQSPSIALFT